MSNGLGPRRQLAREPERLEDPACPPEKRGELLDGQGDILDEEDDGLASDVEDDDAEDVAVQRVLVRVVPRRVRARAGPAEDAPAVVPGLGAGGRAVDL